MLLSSRCYYLVFTVSIVAPDKTKNLYDQLRQSIIESEESEMMGSDIILDENELKANERLMEVKLAEYDASFVDPSKVLTAQHFFLVRTLIEQSRIFQILRKLPKGGSLHGHLTALASDAYVFNMTHQIDNDNLYVCIVDGRLKFQFYVSDQSKQKCNWKLIKDVRCSNASFDDFIKSQITILTDTPAEDYADIDVVWKRFENTFVTMSGLLHYINAYKLHFERILQEHYDDNVMYLEIRTGLNGVYDKKGRTLSNSQIANITIKVIERFKRSHPKFIGAKVIYAKSRTISRTNVTKHLKNAIKLKNIYPNFVVGFDLIGQEDKGKPLIDFADILQKGRKYMNFYFHTGETNWYGTTSDENLIDSVLLRSKRLGHAYALLKHPIVMKYIKKYNIGLEICPISNQVLKLVDDIRNHPASMYISKNYPIIIANDDPGFWGATGLSYDWYYAYMGMASRHADLRFLKRLAMNSLNHSAMSIPEKSIAFVKWNRDWQNFINWLINY